MRHEVPEVAMGGDAMAGKARMEDVRALLAACQLPVDDLTDDGRIGFHARFRDGRLIGVVGLEGQAPVGLLRSLAVEPSARGAGAAKALVSELEAAAAASGLEALYLLTETAQRFFARRGYVVVDRTRAPEAIRATREFSGLCPDSAQLMFKPLRFDSPAVRAAQVSDTAAMAAIYNAGIEERIATFETRSRSPEELEAWFDGRHPVVVAECNGRVLAFAASSGYRARDCYRGVAEFSVYVDPAGRRTGLGRAVVDGLAGFCARAGYWKLLSRVFPENVASLAMLARAGFRQVGTYHRHARLDGVWRDVVIVERLLDQD